MVATHPTLTRLLCTFEAGLGRLRAFSSNHRGAFTVLGVGLFAAGLGWALMHAPSQLWQDLKPTPWLFYLLGLAACSLLASAKSLQVSAQMVQSDVRDGASLVYVSTANLLELLPLPGGALTRAIAIRQGGASITNSGMAILLSAGLTLALTLVICGLALVALQHTIGWAVLVTGLAASGVITFGIARMSRGSIAAKAVLIRLVLFAFSVLRLYCALQLLGEAASLVGAALMSVAITAGTAISLVPAGMGVSELLAGGFATLTETAPALAILAVAANRVMTLVTSGIVCLIAGGTLRGKQEVRS